MAKAQYESIRSPLSTDDKEMIKRYKLKTMKLYFVNGAKDSLTHFLNYDKKGMLVHTLSDGVYYNYEYDKNENTVRMTDSFRDKENGKANRDTFLFEYDKNNILKHARFNDDVSEFIYDQTTLTLVERRRNANWPEPVNNSYTYNKDKDIEELHFQDPGSSTVTTEKIKYNADHKVLTDMVSVVTRNEDIDSITSTYAYSPKGKVLKEETVSTTYAPSGKKSKHITRQDFYDDKSRLLEEFLIEDGVEKERYVFTYNDKSYEPTSETYINKGTIQRTDTFELDDKGLPKTLTEVENGVTTKFKYKFETW
jgi:hypothetical protein